MDKHTYEELWHYSEQFTRDKIQRSELVTMAWKQGLKLGDRCSPGLMKSIMHFRSKELKFRSAFPSDEVGKSQRDIWNKAYRIELDKPVVDKNGHQLTNEFLIPVETTPLNHLTATDFIEKLTMKERMLLEYLIAGFNFKEIAKRLKVTCHKLKAVRVSLETKAVMCLT